MSMPEHNDSAEHEDSPAPVRAWRIAFLVLCTVGVCLSADLWRLHINVHTDPEYHSYCAMSERVNCETVAASDFALFLGLPTAVWGLLGYALMGALAIWGLRRRLRSPTWPVGVLFVLSAFSSALGVVLLIISHFVIESVCLVCAGTYAVSFALLGVSVFELQRLRTSAWQALLAELRTTLAAPSVPAVFAGAFALVTVALWIFVPPYWRVEVGNGPGGHAVGITAEGGHWLGSKKPRLTITEFSDYQCPHCQRGHDELRKLLDQHPEGLRLVHRHYPLDHHCNPAVRRPFHQFACDYAVLAHCAGEQNKFWQANDVLFEQGRRREIISPAELAGLIDVDADKLATCMRSEQARQVIQRDLAAGTELGIRGTPTFVIGETTYPGRIPPDIIERALHDTAAEAAHAAPRTQAPQDSAAPVVPTPEAPAH